MEPMPSTWLAALGLVFALGVKHGLDADHLAAIDGLVRFNSRHRPRLAPWCGALFSLGHGAVVGAIALCVGTIARDWKVPAAMVQAGAWISIAVLALLGVLNIAAVLGTGPGDVVRPVGVRTGIFRRLQQAGTPWLVALVGTVFALSFDTLSQAALFALAGVHFGGTAHALALALSFTLGMFVTDGANGLWVARLARRADRTARIASRVMGLGIGTLSLSVAAYGTARYASPAVSRWSDENELLVSLAVVLAAALTFAFCVRAARRAAEGEEVRAGD